MIPADFWLREEDLNLRPGRLWAAVSLFTHGPASILGQFLVKNQQALRYIFTGVVFTTNIMRLVCPIVSPLKNLNNLFLGRGSRIGKTAHIFLCIFRHDRKVLRPDTQLL